MGFFLRKSVNLGPLRFNFSTRGVGISTGVKGARISTGPTGTYVHLGAKGIYYRKKLSSSSRSKKEAEDHTSPFEDLNTSQLITTSNFGSVSDAESQDFIKELSIKHNRIYLHRWFVLLSVISSLLFLASVKSKQYTSEIDQFQIVSDGANLRSEPSTQSEVIKVGLKGETFLLLSSEENWSKIGIEESGVAFVHNSTGQVLSTPISKRDIQLAELFHSPYEYLIPIYVFILLAVLFYFADRQRKRIRLIYEMDTDLTIYHKKLIQSFNEIFDVSVVWQKTTVQQSENRKYSSGASRIVDRIKIKSMKKNQRPTPSIITNVKVPYLGLRGIDLFFFPERLILRRGNRFASVLYKNLKIKEDSTHFVESGRIPKDAEIVDGTWKYVNKDGSPDLRFRNNRELPVCQYSEYHFWCLSGINEVIMTSKIGGLHEFVKTLSNIGQIEVGWN